MNELTEEEFTALEDALDDCEVHGHRGLGLLCAEIGDERPNAEMREAILEVQRMKADPSIGKAYTDVDDMMKDILG